MISLTIDLHSYIAHPYWPEQERLINIIKESGMSRARSSANRRKALEEYLRQNDMSLTEYEKLEQAAARPFYTDDNGNILIPKRSVEAFLVSVCDQARAANRPCPPDMVRTLLRASAWTTNVTPADALTWERYAVVTAGTGAKLSNQRALRRNDYVGAEPPAGAATKPVVATGTIDVNVEMVKPEVLRHAIEWGGEWIGIGASRKMGWGRFVVVGFDIE